MEAGFLLRRLQRGQNLASPHSRPMPSINRQCHQIQVNGENQTWGIIYHLAADAVIILGVFSKKTSATPDEILKTCK